MNSIAKNMPVDNPELLLILQEMKTIKRFGLAGLELPFEQVEMYNMVLDMKEQTIVGQINE